MSVPWTFPHHVLQDGTLAGVSSVPSLYQFSPLQPLATPMLGSHTVTLCHLYVSYCVPCQMNLLLREYLLSGEVSEAEHCLRELEVPHFHHELVYEVRGGHSRAVLGEFPWPC